MLAVGLDAESLMQTIDGKARDEFGQRASVAAINSPSAVTVAGDSDVLDDIAGSWTRPQIFNRYLSVKVPYHTHYMDAVKDDLVTRVRGSVVESGDAAAVFDGHRRTVGRICRPAPRTGGRTPAPPFFSNRRYAACWMTDTPTSSSWARIPSWRRRSSKPRGKQRVSVMATQRRDHDDGRTLTELRWRTALSRP